MPGSGRTSGAADVLASSRGAYPPVTSRWPRWITRAKLARLQPQMEEQAKQSGMKIRLCKFELVEVASETKAGVWGENKKGLNEGKDSQPSRAHDGQDALGEEDARGAFGLRLAHRVEAAFRAALLLRGEQHVARGPRRFDCCRKAGVITLNTKPKKEEHDERRSGTGD